METHTLDATDKALGRIASEAAILLMGKNRPDYAKNLVAPNKVEIINAAKLRLTDKKMGEKSYKSYSGYPGGLKTTSLPETIAKKGHRELVRKAIHGMLPANKLRPKMMNNLVIKD